MKQKNNSTGLLTELNDRILLLDGAMGTMIQALALGVLNRVESVALLCKHCPTSSLSINWSRTL